MKKLIVLCMATALLASCGNSSKQNADQAKIDSLTNELNMKQQEADDLVEIINVVQDGFRQIDEAEGRINLETDSENSLSQKDKINEQVNFIIEKMAENREQIAKLQKIANSNKNASAKLRSTIEALTKQLEEKEASIKSLQAELEKKNIKIAQLDSTVSHMGTQINDLQADNAHKAKIVDAQDKMINKGWYVYGTKKELKDHKILDGGEFMTNKDFDRDYFTEVDIRDFKELPLYTKRASVETSHPSGSYEIVKDEKGQCVLKIKNSRDFWSVSRYLVITVK